MALHALHRQHPVLDLAAHVAAFLMPAPRQLRRPADWEIAHYATQTWRNGVLISSTPEITYGELRGRS